MKITNKTYMEKENNVNREWHLFDVGGEVLGRVATEIAKKLIGKEKSTYTPHVNVGDKVVVINASKIQVTNNKESKKRYFWHTGYPGGIRSLTFKQMMAKSPAKVMRKAVKRMIPQNKLLKGRMNNLYIYSGAEHPHGGQLNGREMK